MTVPGGGPARKEGPMGATPEHGQATAEYALVLVAAAIVAIALITWASTTDMLPSFFNTVMGKVISLANGVG
jgi:Flp pilus assembly pilin Flp